VFFNMLILFPLDIYPVGDCWIMVVAVLIFWGTSILFSLTVLIYIPTNDVQGFSFLHIFASAFLLRSFC
jgi:hypothetical protein